MTKLTERKSKLVFTAEAAERYRGKLRNIVIEPGNDGYNLTVRLHGTRVRYPLSWNCVFTLAAKKFAEQQRQEKIAARKAKRDAR